MRGCNIKGVLISSIAALLTSASANATDAVNEPEKIVTAIWRVQQLDFDYRTFDTYYSCSALQSKIIKIMGMAGAQPGVAVGLRCSNAGVGTVASATIAFVAPVEATADNVRDATTFDSKAQLVAQLRGFQLPTQNDIQKFPTTWRKMSISNRGAHRLDAGDCSLLKSLRDQILPHMAIRITKDLGNCSGRILKMEFMTLVPSAEAVQVKNTM